MLSALLRTASIVSLLLSSTACEFGSTPSLGQSSSTNRKKDAGSADGEARRPGRVAVASGEVDADAEVDAAADVQRDAGAEAGEGGAGGTPGKPATPTKNSAGAGGSKPVDNDKDPAPNPPTDAGAPSPADAGTQPAMDAAIDGGRPMVEDPFGVLDGLAERTAGGKTAATINQFLETLATGDAPASSIQEFLLAIDAEVDCKKNGWATECLAACQAVATTCAVCVFDEACRTTMLDICGVAALAGCVPRR